MKKEQARRQCQNSSVKRGNYVVILIYSDERLQQNKCEKCIRENFRGENAIKIKLSSLFLEAS